MSSVRIGGQPRVKKNQQFLTFLGQPWRFDAGGVTAAGKLDCHCSEKRVVWQGGFIRIDGKSPIKTPLAAEIIGECRR
jgi:hypothetical protein